MGNVVTREIRIADITIGNRYRKDLGGLDNLADSIKRLGLLQPIGVTPDNVLIFGERRLEAFRRLGHHTIPARVLDIVSILEGEYDENEARKEFTFSERIALAEAIEKELEGRNHRPAKSQDPGPDLPKGQTRDLVAEKVGFGSGKQYERAKAIVELGEPELVDAVDSGEVAIKPAAEFAKQAPEKQAEQIKQADGNVVDAVKRFRQSLPTKKEARKIAVESAPGTAILGKDGKWHTAATDEERACGEVYLRLVEALRELRDLKHSPEELVACVSEESSVLFTPLINETVEQLLAIRTAWKSRYAA